MHYRVAGDGGSRLLVVFPTGDEIVAGLEALARERDIRLARFTAIGALEHVELRAFDVEQKKYTTIATLDEQLELVSLVGDISRDASDGDAVIVHAHAAVGRADASVLGGHVGRAVVRPTCELVLDVLPDVAAKTTDPDWGLPLFEL